MKRTSYSHARQNLSDILNQVVDDSEIFCIERANGKKAILIEKSNYDHLLETAYLLRSPKNTQELMKGMIESQQNIGEKVDL